MSALLTAFNGETISCKATRSWNDWAEGSVSIINGLPYFSETLAYQISGMYNAPAYVQVTSKYTGTLSFGISSSGYAYNPASEKVTLALDGITVYDTDKYGSAVCVANWPLH